MKIKSVDNLGQDSAYATCQVKPNKDDDFNNGGFD